METIYLNRENLGIWQEKAKPKVMALGCFDGLHTGHCQVINTAFEKAKEQNVQLAVMSFFPHPKSVVESGKKQGNETRVNEPQPPQGSQTITREPLLEVQSTLDGKIKIFLSKIFGHESYG